MKMLSITLKDLQVFLKDRGAVIMLFILPFIFIVALAVVSQGARVGSGSGEVKKLNLVVVNGDQDGKFAQAILDSVESTGKFAIVNQDQALTEKQLNQSTIRQALFIPANFSSDIEAGKQVSLRLEVHPVSDEASLMAVERAVNRAARDVMTMAYLNKGLEQMAAMQAGDPQSEAAFSQERIQQQIAQQAAQAAQRPLIKVVEVNPAKTEGEETTFPTYSQYIVLGMAVMFVFLGAQNTAASIFKEKKLGSFRRLMAAPISKAGLLGGKLLPNLVLSLVQIAVILFTGGYLIQFFGVEPLDFSSDPLGLAIIALATALCSTSLGIFIASLVKTEAQVGGLSSVLLFVAGLLSGSFIPLFLMAPFFENIGRFMPQYWANQAFFGLVFRGQSLLEVWPNIVALLVFTVVFFGIGLWRFKFE
jgi:ABC-2 type transport system permease protein